MSFNPDYLARKAANEAERCTNWARCGGMRRHLDLVCRPCRSRWEAFGSANGRRIPAATLAPYRRLVDRVLDVNESHPAQLAARQYLDDLLAKATQHHRADRDGVFADWKGARELARLVRHGVTSRDVLAAACAVFVHLHNSPMQTKREERFAIARAVFGLAPRPMRVSRARKAYPAKARASDLHAVGVMLTEHLALMFALVLQGVAATTQADEARRLAVRAPLAVPPARRTRQTAAQAAAA